jgi:predicted nucleotidyltransferase component of viral defense system
VVEIAHDARIREAVQLSFGRVLHPDEVAADKTLALFGRAAARDLVDVAALSGRYTLEQLCELAADTSWCTTWSQAGEGSRERLRTCAT